MSIIHCYNCDNVADDDAIPDGWKERDLGDDSPYDDARALGDAWFCPDCIEESDYRETLRWTRQRNEATEIRALIRALKRGTGV